MADFWNKLVRPPTPIPNIRSLPLYGFQFFFSQLGEFKLVFWLLTLARAIGSVLKFATVYLLGDVISSLSQLSSQRILFFYLPAFFALHLFRESLDYYTRYYGEAFPTVYAEQLTQRFYLTLLNQNFTKLFNLSKERLTQLVGRYVGNVQSFLADWFWGTVSRITQLVLVLIVLYLQNPLVMVINLIYMGSFLWFAFSLSSQFSELAREYSKQTIETGTVTGRMILNLNTIKRLGVGAFFSETYRKMPESNWSWLSKVKSFHARRWFIQLNLFNALYIGTLVYGVFQVRAGSLALGFLVLIKYAFDQLWEILVYVIEYYVTLIQQREDTKIIRNELQTVLISDRVSSELYHPPSWSNLKLKDVSLRFSADSSSAPVLSILEFVVKRGEKIGVVGESGVGKTSLLHILLNLAPIEGRYEIDGKELGDSQIAAGFMTLVGANDPLFNLSVRDNILLGRQIPESRLQSILDGLTVSQFVGDLNRKVGSPEFNLSTGQEARIRLARGLAQDSAIYLLDEPFNGLDLKTRAEVIDFLRSFLRDKTVLLVTHDIDELVLTERTVKIEKGTLAASK